MSKRIRLTVEWDGPECEATQALIISDTIESDDDFGQTRVSEVEFLTNEGSQTTPGPPICESPL